jgi:fluoroquinolone resistance protein
LCKERETLSIIRRYVNGDKELISLYLAWRDGLFAGTGYLVSWVSMDIERGDEFDSEVFGGLELSGVDLRNRVFDNCTFVRSNFLKCDFTGSIFTDCSFKQCELSLCKFVSVGLRGVLFEHSKLVGIDFTKCTTQFLEIAFRKTMIDTCNFSVLPLSGVVFDQGVLRESVFVETNLRKAEFLDIDLAGTSFHNSDLEEADFSSARNYSINLLANKIRNARFSLPEAVSLLRAFEIKLD